MNEFFNDNLPWYVNGTLDSHDREKMDRYIQSNDVAAETLKEFQRFDQQVKEDLGPISDEVPGFARTLARVRAKQSPTTTNAWEKFWNSLKGMRAQYPVFGAVAVTILVAQSAVIVVLFDSLQKSNTDYAQYRSLQQEIEIGPFIQVSFSQDAKELDIRTLLVSIGAINVGGPSQLGDYYIHVSPDQIDWAVRQLQMSPYVRDAAIVSKVPPVR
ncbi:MAG: hypothetical protein V4568_14400 [Pseudomonadota bacterium]